MLPNLTVLVKDGNRTLVATHLAFWMGVRRPPRRAVSTADERPEYRGQQRAARATNALPSFAMALARPLRVSSTA
jgi:hypothetical protein